MARPIQPKQANLPSKSVANLAALAALSIAGWEGNGICYVQSLQCYFELGALEVAIPSEIVTAAGGAYSWYRTASAAWSRQATWYVDSATGNDENAGTALAPLASWAEFRRRVSTLKVSMTVWIVANLAEGIIGDFFAAQEGLTLVVVGVPTVAADAGVVTTFTDPVLTLGACAQGTMTSGAIADFTPHIGRFLLATGGYIAPILGADAGGAPFLPFWARANLSNAKPANGTHVDVVDLPTATCIQLSAHDGLLVEVDYLKFTSANFVDASSVFSTNSVTGVTLMACDFAGFWACSTDTYAIGCQLSGAGSFYGYEVTRFIGGGSRRTVFLGVGDKVSFQGFLIQGGAGLTVGNGTNAAPPSSVALAGTALGLGVFGSSGIGVTLGGGAYVNGGILYGSGNTGVGLSINFGARMQLAVPSTITGTGGDDLSFCGAATAIPPLTGGAVVPAASALTTWAQLAAAPFGGDVMNYSNGTTISLT